MYLHLFFFKTPLTDNITHNISCGFSRERVTWAISTDKFIEGWLLDMHCVPSILVVYIPVAFRQQQVSSVARLVCNGYGLKFSRPTIAQKTPELVKKNYFP